MAKRRRIQRTPSPSPPTPSRSHSPTPPLPNNGRMDRKTKFNHCFKTATTSPEAVLVMQLKTWTSVVYGHYNTPKFLTVNDEIKYVFTCKKNPSVKVTRCRYDESTSNLVRHADNCEPGHDISNHAISAFARESTYSVGKFRLKLDLWIARRHRPFAIVEDPEFIELLTMLYNKVSIPSARTISRDIQEIFKVGRMKVVAMLKSHSGKIHLCIDGWTSPNVMSFIGITAHWIQDGQLQNITLDYIRASKAHTGIYLANHITNCLHDFELQNKILGLTLDNAANNNTLVKELGEMLEGYQGSLTRVRCFAHVLNLVVKAILSQFTKEKSGGSNDNDDDNNDDDDDSDGEILKDTEGAEDESDGDELDPAVHASDMIMIEEIVKELDGNEVNDEEEFGERRSLTDEELSLGRFAISKLKNLAKQVFHSATLREDLKTLCKRFKIKAKLMIRAVVTRWNTLTEVIGRALEFQELLSNLVTLEQHNKGARGVRLNCFKLSKQEWELLGQLHPLLDMFLEATKKVSHSKTPLVHEIIPICDILTRTLDDFVDDTSKIPVVRAVARRGRAMINKYYSLTDDSVIYRIAMLLHPRYKALYFTIAKWPKEWIATAEQLLREQWAKSYRPAVPAMPLTTKTSETRKTNYFAEIDDFGKNLMVSDDPITDWLASPPLTNVNDPIAWWTAMDAAGHPLSRMALNFLSVPATSTDVERSFSFGGLTVSKMRHALNDKSVRAATLVGSWVAFPGLIPSDELIQSFNDKNKRSKDSAPILTGEQATEIVLD